MITQELVDKLPKNEYGEPTIETDLYTLRFIRCEDFDYLIHFEGKNDLRILSDLRELIETGDDWDKPFNEIMSKVNKIHLAAGTSFMEMFDLSCGNVCPGCIEYMPCKHIG